MEQAGKPWLWQIAGISETPSASVLHLIQVNLIFSLFFYWVGKYPTWSFEKEVGDGVWGGSWLYFIAKGILALLSFL